MADRESRVVLIVDGSPTMLYYHGILLKRLEYVVLTAATPEDALKILDHMTPSLILTAISFLSMNGVDFIKTIKSREDTRAVPVIVFTAEEQASVRSTCLGLGCLAYFIKPVDAGTLYLTIQAALEPTPREHLRLNTLLKIAVSEEDAKDVGERIEYATAISEKGAYVRTLAPKAKNTLITLRIYLKDREIKAKAVVLYTHALQQGAFREPGMGLRFVEMSENDRMYLRDFINTQLTSDIIISL